MRSLLGQMLVPFSVVMIGAGLWQVGGPEQARMEQRDMIRMQDVRALVNHKRCQALTDRGPGHDCGPIPRTVDRFTQVPYEIGADRVCATFEQPTRITDMLDVQFKDGCLAVD